MFDQEFFLGILVFDEGYVPRMWGGTKLWDVYQKTTPENTAIGEAWLIADHSEYVSKVISGPKKKKSLRQLMKSDSKRILGNLAKPTKHGRFPLLLKLLDAGDKLSIQVHPNDQDAERLHEPDVGKTEMWHVLQADPGADLYCGLNPELDRTDLAAILEAETLTENLTKFPAEEGASIFVPAKTVHAIGGGSLLAEIQQNSDVTYRLYDWGRVQPDGTPRPLHVEKSLEVTAYGSHHQGAAAPIGYVSGTNEISIHGVCEFFAGEHWTINEPYTRYTRGDSCFLLLGKEGVLTLTTEDDSHTLNPGKACLIEGCAQSFTVAGAGKLLAYYVPDIQKDVVEPLLAEGHNRDSIIQLGGDPTTSAIKI
jgi:mannose-6-phosphate isomerase